MEITKRVKMHKTFLSWKLLPLVLIVSNRAANLLLVKKIIKAVTFYTLLFVQLLNIYFFSESFLLLPFNQCLGASYLILGAGLVVKASCCQIILYILHFARFPILIFKINFAISAFGNFLRNVQLKWFHFNHPSHTTKSVLMAIIFWQTRQNHFELFFLS